MSIGPAPRHFVASPALPGAGLPHDRMAQMAARQAFVALKRCFIEAVAAVPDARGDWLRQQVRSAEEPIDLWLLRAPVFAGLAGSDPVRRARRQQLRSGLDSLFLDSGPASCFSGL
jgi:AcrR family transcriptional regulator